MSRLRNPVDWLLLTLDVLSPWTCSATRSENAACEKPRGLIAREDALQAALCGCAAVPLREGEDRLAVGRDMRTTG